MSTTVVAAATWSLLGFVAEGLQFDAAKGPDGNVHVIAGEYVQVDPAHDVVVSEPQSDGLQGPYDFAPAIAVDDAGNTHIVTRSGGSIASGTNVQYRRRSATGTWDPSVPIGTPVARNYVVGVAPLPGRVLVTSSHATNGVWGEHRVFEIDGVAATPLGSLPDIWRADCGVRVRSTSDRIWMASGKPDPNGITSVLSAASTSAIVTELGSSRVDHYAGTGRKGFADLALDGTGGAHLTYGADQAVYYNRYTPAGDWEFAQDVLIGSNLGAWHLSTGISAVGASEDGETVLAVLLQTQGEGDLHTADLLWSLSEDGGVTWTTPADLGVDTVGTEGRVTPRIVNQGDDFQLFFHNASTGVIELAVLNVEQELEEVEENPEDEDPDPIPSEPDDPEEPTEVEDPTGPIETPARIPIASHAKGCATAGTQGLWFLGLLALVSRTRRNKICGLRA